MREAESILPFLRRRDYIFIKELGQGACGKTVLLRDDTIDREFVCKKYAPSEVTYRQELYENFLREIRLLHDLLHPNVVRVFNYYLYPEQLAGYILMEHIQGSDIEEYIAATPEQVNEIYLQTIEGFSYLESVNILHRDIRPQNILVRTDGVVKIIDLGFGKRIEVPEDFNRSISLNWWCDPPPELSQSIYNFTSEVYFVGKLFERIIQDYDIQHFKYASVLRKMCIQDPANRIQSFFDTKKEVMADQFQSIDFTGIELRDYRQFSSLICQHLTNIQSGAKYITEPERIQINLENVFRSCMLEEEVPDAASVLRCFLSGPYYYKRKGFPTHVLRNFLQFFKACSVEKQRIAIANLHTRFDAIDRYEIEPTEDDIPF